VTYLPLTSSFQRSLARMSHSELAQVLALLERLTLATTTRLLFRQTAERTTKSLRQAFFEITEPRGKTSRAQKNDRTPQTPDRLQEWLQQEVSKIQNQFTEDQIRKRILPALVQRSSYGGSLRNQVHSELALLTVFRDVGKEYGIRTEKQNPVRLVEEVLAAVTNDLLQQAHQAFVQASHAQKEQILRRLRKNLDSLDPAAREELKRSLGIERLTADALLKALRSGPAVGGALLAANATGMGVFLFATTVTHAVFTTLLGITVPFAAYQTLTTVLGALLGPLGWAAASGAVLLTFLRQRRRFDRRVMGQVLFFIYATGLPLIQHP